MYDFIIYLFFNLQNTLGIRAARFRGWNQIVTLLIRSVIYLFKYLWLHNLTNYISISLNFVIIYEYDYNNNEIKENKKYLYCKQGYYCQLKQNLKKTSISSIWNEL